MSAFIKKSVLGIALSGILLSPNVFADVAEWEHALGTVCVNRGSLDIPPNKLNDYLPTESGIQRTSGDFTYIYKNRNGTRCFRKDASNTCYMMNLQKCDKYIKPDGNYSKMSSSWCNSK